MPPTRILLDQNTPLGLRGVLPGYEVIPARSLGWATIENSSAWLQRRQRAGTRQRGSDPRCSWRDRAAAWLEVAGTLELIGLAEANAGEAIAAGIQD
jgi:hypothetical protein